MSVPARQTVQVKGRLKPDPSRGLPEARIDFTLILEKKRGKVAAKVTAAYLTLTDRAGEVARTLPFDDGRAALDLNARGQVIGIELLTGQGPYSLSEFGSYVNRASDPVVLAGANTIVQAWPRVEVLANVAMDVMREARSKLGLPALETVNLEKDVAEEFRKELEPRFRRDVVSAA